MLTEMFIEVVSARRTGQCPRVFAIRNRQHGEMPVQHVYLWHMNVDAKSFNPRDMHAQGYDVIRCNLEVSAQMPGEPLMYFRLKRQDPKNYDSLRIWCLANNIHDAEIIACDKPRVPVAIVSATDQRLNYTAITDASLGDDDLSMDHQSHIADDEYSETFDRMDQLLQARIDELALNNLHLSQELQAINERSFGSDENIAKEIGDMGLTIETLSKIIEDRDVTIASLELKLTQGDAEIAELLAKLDDARTMLSKVEDENHDLRYERDHLLSRLHESSDCESLTAKLRDLLREADQME